MNQRIHQLSPQLMILQHMTAVCGSWPNISNSQAFSFAWTAEDNPGIDFFCVYRSLCLHYVLLNLFGRCFRPSCHFRLDKGKLPNLS